MPVGLEIIGDSGSYQIINDTLLYQYSHKATYSASSYSGTSFLTKSVAGTATSLIAIHSPDTYIVYESMTYADGTWTVRFKPYTAISTAYTVEFHVFDVGLSAPSGNFGLQVFDASGEIMFSSNRNVFQITAKITSEPALASTAPTYSLSGTVPAKWGFVICQPKFSYLQTSATTGATQAYAIKCSSSAVSITWGYGGPGQPVDTPVSGMVGYVIDLKGLT